MFDIRQHIATDGLKLMLEGSFSSLVELTSPDGTIIKTNEDGDPLRGEILYDRDAMDPETGNLITVSTTKITLRKSALSQVPKAGEKWGIKFPVNPAIPEVLSTFVLDTGRAPTDGQSIGFISLFPKDLKQS